MFDVAISSDGDLIISGNRDLAGIDGTNLIEQRMRLRCRIPRGEWVYDDDRRLGSKLHTILGSDPAKAIPEIQVFINEALRGMEDATIQEIQVNQEGRQLTAIIAYEPVVPSDEIKTIEEDFEQLFAEITVTPS
jgi:hypothetical protein